MRLFNRKKTVVSERKADGLHLPFGSKRSQEPADPENVKPTDIMIILKGAAAIRARVAADAVGLSVSDFIKQAVAKEVSEANRQYE